MAALCAIGIETFTCNQEDEAVNGKGSVIEATADVDSVTRPDAGDVQRGDPHLAPAAQVTLLLLFLTSHMLPQHRLRSCSCSCPSHMLPQHRLRSCS
jgi:hypothetical protein